MSKTVEIVLSDRLMAEVNPVLAENQLDLESYVLEAVRWYITSRRENRPDIAVIDDIMDQNNILAQVHEELTPYTVDTLRAALGEEEEDWETLLA